MLASCALSTLHAFEHASQPYSEHFLHALSHLTLMTAEWAKRGSYLEWETAKLMWERERCCLTGLSGQGDRMNVEDKNR